MEGVGTFYIYYGDIWSGDQQLRRTLVLTYYDPQRQIKHTRDHIGLIGGHRAGAPPDIAISKNMFLIYRGRDSAALIYLDDRWESCSVVEVSASVLNTIIDTYTRVETPAPIVQSALSKVRHATEGDFSLTSENGDVIKVHRPVMEALWPFFKGMVDSQMKEADENTVNLSMPTSTLEVIVRHLYEEPLGMGFDDAARLVVFAQMYDLPDLLVAATDIVKEEVLGITQAIFLWQMSFEASNSELQDYAAAQIVKLMPKTKNFDEHVSALEKEELVALFKDISGSLGK